MKLASLAGGRDGHLVIVSEDLGWYAPANGVAPTLQAALDEWPRCRPLLLELTTALERGLVPRQRFDQTACGAPLPRAYQWIDASAYLNHVALVRKARGAEMPKSFWTDPLMYQGGSDSFLGPYDAIPLKEKSWGCDCEAEVAVILDDVPMGISDEAARAHIALIVLVNDVSLRELVPSEIAKGFGFFQSKPSSAFSPLAVTPESLGGAWDGAKLHLPLLTRINSELIGKPNAGDGMAFDFGRLIAHAARTRALGAGTILGGGTVSNSDRDGTPGRAVDEGGNGYSCIAELRMVEMIREGAAKTPFLRPGDRVEIEMLDFNGRSIFGCIDQVVASS
jgi:fumarylacetoacetate (FAA) hydrolase